MTNSQWMSRQWCRVYRECDIPTKHGLVQYTWYSIKLTSSCPQKNCDQYMFWSWYVCSLTSISTLSLWLWECSYGDEYFASSVYPLIDAWLWLWHLVWTTTDYVATTHDNEPIAKWMVWTWRNVCSLLMLRLINEPCMSRVSMKCVIIHRALC